ncbi:nickel-dependent hydrogenase large subunit [Paludibaculum fermentans]|uniref:Nickel-dependent hydrogenase large subunit n=1 Tax=Paludibaculum fermentans TaxID=1473598 RepID=A0A7S7SLX2_PALFE|nr:nickel-dependent hydrogenase large subunit [Paludibaculum fermentans]QOY88911.1 nickel-dependent hydrogenase large subunit [Paludibaculum fermentans]
MATRIVVDPVTRIEGHLRVEAILDDQRRVKDAMSTGTMWRGIEVILQGRDPRDAWAFTERICGVCTTVHALTSVRAVENALGIQVPRNADSIRNIMFLAQMIHDHVVHFYHLHALDWVDIVSTLKADPAATAALAQKVSPHWPKSTEGYFRDTQARLKKFVESGQLGLFQNAYWGHPAYKLPPEANLMAVAHYLEALAWQKEIVKIHTVFGGKNPHPNYLVGGMASAFNMQGDNAINQERLNLVKEKIEEAAAIVNDLYIPDLLAVASFYPEWAAIGGGLGNFMAYGDVPQNGVGDPAQFRLPRGIILGRNLAEVVPLDHADANQITEEISHSWYQYAGGKTALHPWDGETTPHYTGPKPPYKNLDETKPYSWLKAPRWKGKAMEVGPLSRMLVGYASGRTEFKDIVNDALGKLKAPPAALFSTLGRTAARGLEAALCVGWLRQEYDRLIANLRNGDSATADTRRWDPSTWPKETKGYGFTEAPRGALAHWIHIKDGKIANYQCIVPSTWNASPRDAQGQLGAYESALIGTPMADPARPLEILRTIHSFDPCLACASHVFGPDGEKLAEVVVR